MQPAKREPMSVVVQSDALEHRSVLGAELREDVAVSDRDFGDEIPGLACPGFDPSEPDVEGRDGKQEAILPEPCAPVAELHESTELIAVRRPFAEPNEARLGCRLAPETQLERRIRRSLDAALAPADGDIEDVAEARDERRAEAAECRAPGRRE